MSATIISGTQIAKQIRAELATEIQELTAHHRAPSLHVVLCGDNPASAPYVRMKSKAAAEIGIDLVVHRPSAESSTVELVMLVEQLNADPAVDGMIVQLPLPSQDEDAIVQTVDPLKDADCLHPFNFGQLAQGNPPVALPCTPAGCMELIRRSGVEIRGSRSVVIGRSAIVGRPMASMLTNEDSTVTVCHSKTPDLARTCREADILIAAIGRPGMITADFVKPGSCVIDVGITPVDGKVLGDVDRESVEPVAGFLTPVPGGVGPMTIAMLLRNTVMLAKAHHTPAHV